MNDAARQAGDAARQGPMVSGNQVIAAGFASAAAAVVTSRFGVAGTLLGAALTTMIITGGSAILKAYLETMTGNVRKVPGRLRARRERRKAERYGEPESLPERPDLRDNFTGRMRAALDWFSHLPPLSRRSILVKGLIAAAIAFIIGMTAVWGVERVINNSLSCGFWANCPEGAEPGIRLTDDGRGAGSSISFGRARTQAQPGTGTNNPAVRQDGFGQGGSQGGGSQAGGSQGGGLFQQQQNRNSQQGGSQDSGGRPSGVLDPERPSDPETPVQPETPNSASPAPESPAPGQGEEPEPGIRPQDASPSPSE